MTDDVDYAEQFARLALALHEQLDVPQTVHTVLAWGIRAVGADAGSVLLLRRGGRAAEIAGTDGAAAVADQLQVELGQGPSLVSAAGRVDQDSYLIGDTLTDKRWPVWSTRIAGQLGLRSALSTRLCTGTERVGAVSLYARRPDAFDYTDVAVASVLARHAAVALAETDTRLQLERAVDARKTIGQAQGIIMERYNLEADQAFAVLRRYSQDNNTKLHTVAQRLIDTRRLPGPGTPPPADGAG